MCLRPVSNSSSLLLWVTEGRSLQQNSIGFDRPLPSAGGKSCPQEKGKGEPGCAFPCLGQPGLNRQGSFQGLLSPLHFCPQGILAGSLWQVPRPSSSPPFSFQPVCSQIRSLSEWLKHTSWFPAQVSAPSKAEQAFHKPCVPPAWKSHSQVPNTPCKPSWMDAQSLGPGPSSFPGCPSFPLCGLTKPCSCFKPARMSVFVKSPLIALGSMTHPCSGLPQVWVHRLLGLTAASPPQHTWQSQGT